ncbi:sulfur carrier protein ThiS [Pseudonocardia nigra]|uniref:sulfur carrier protein ThiS n=1 Tax=Pseudonocardia nigra TaxID=1921578 RepID=UPI001C5DE066|nr:sulfur carrier protein ThiS [Pseudonocardia nigra]
MQVFINGEQCELGPGASVLDAVQALGVPGTGVAVAVDGEVVPRAVWPQTRLGEGSRIEVLTAVQGG